MSNISRSPKRIILHLCISLEKAYQITFNNFKCVKEVSLIMIPKVRSFHEKICILTLLYFLFLFSKIVIDIPCNKTKREREPPTAILDTYTCNTFTLLSLILQKYLASAFSTFQKELIICTSSFNKKIVTVLHDLIFHKSNHHFYRESSQV